MPRKFSRITLIVILSLLSLVFITLAWMPYRELKVTADSLVRDGSFKALNETNAIIFRGLLAGAGILLVTAAVFIWVGYTNRVIAWLRQYFLDAGNFLKDLKPEKLEWVPVTCLVLVTGTALLLRLPYINQAINHDEGYTYVVFGSTSLFNILTNYHLPNNHVLNSLLINLSTHLFGNQTWAVRLPAFLAGLLLIPATYTLARKMYDKSTALLSAVLISVLPGAIAYSTRARGYPLVALFTVVALLLAYYIRQKNNLFAWSLLVVFIALGFYSVPVMLFPFGMVYAWLFFECIFSTPPSNQSRSKFLARWFLSGVSTVVLVLLLYTPIFIYSGIDKVFANPFVKPEPWAEYIPTIPHIATWVWNSWTNGLPTVTIYLLLAGFCLGLILHQKIARHQFPLPAAAFFGMGILLLVQRPSGETKIWSFLQAPFMIWCAAGFIGLLNLLPLKPQRKVIVTAVAVGAALIGITVSAIKVLPSLHERWAEVGPVEETVSAIRKQITPDDLILVDIPFDTEVWYYAKLDGISEDFFDQSRPFSRLFVIVTPSRGQTLQSVIQSRGIELSAVNLASDQLQVSFGFLDTYLVQHR